MKRLLALMLCAVSLGAAAQVTYPYNPDGNADTLIGVTDLQDLLTNYGQPFLPSEILVGDSTLSSWIYQLSETVSLQQATIESLLDQLDQAQSDVWYQSWHPSIHSEFNVARDPNTIFYNGFIAPKTGVLTHMKVRLNGCGGYVPDGELVIGAALYNSDNSDYAADDRLVPSSLMTQGLTLTDGKAYQIVEIEFDPVEVEKGKVYFAALTQRIPSSLNWEDFCAFQGNPFYSLGAGGGLVFRGGMNSQLPYPALTWPSIVTEQDVQVTGDLFWFIVD